MRNEYYAYVSVAVSSCLFSPFLFKRRFVMSFYVIQPLPSDLGEFYYVSVPSPTPIPAVAFPVYVHI